MRYAVAMAIVLVAFAGCLYDDPGVLPYCDASSADDIVHNLLTYGGGRSDPRQPWDALVFVSSPSSLVRIEAAPLPRGWQSEIDNLDPDPDGPAFARVRLIPGPAPAGGPLGLSWEIEAPADASCISGSATGIGTALATPSFGELASPGKGAHVFTAGFYENGTLFYTNMDLVQNGSWNKAGWYEYGGGDHLPVYVYDKSRDEKSATWGYTPPDFIPGVHSSTVTPWDYFTTIEGFNEALKGLSTNTASVVHIPPEKAYTLQGREDHPLYGSALVFYIEVVEVVDVPCPARLPSSCETELPALT